MMRSILLFNLVAWAAYGSNYYGCKYKENQPVLFKHGKIDGKDDILVGKIIKATESQAYSNENKYRIVYIDGNQFQEIIKREPSILMVYFPFLDQQVCYTNKRGVMSRGLTILTRPRPFGSDGDKMYTVDQPVKGNKNKVKLRHNKLTMDSDWVDGDLEDYTKAWNEDNDNKNKKEFGFFANIVRNIEKVYKPIPMNEKVPANGTVSGRSRAVSEKRSNRNPRLQNKHFGPELPFWERYWNNFTSAVTNYPWYVVSGITTLVLGYFYGEKILPRKMTEALHIRKTPTFFEKYWMHALGGAIVVGGGCVATKKLCKEESSEGWFSDKEEDKKSWFSLGKTRSANKKTGWKAFFERHIQWILIGSGTFLILLCCCCCAGDEY